MSRRRMEVAFGDFWELLRILVELRFVAIQQATKRRPRSFVMCDPVPLRITGKFRKDLGDMSKQFLPFRW